FTFFVKDKYNYIGLSQTNLRVHYKGHGKTHKDASSVRATCPIPASCGLYYFEVKIVSKGRDGYMGVGLCAHDVNMNRLPGWDKQSYGYHGDDGHSFCSSGQGQAYGPTFTTGDVIGCGINLMDGSCFYTKNGHHLGVAFRDLPPNLFPTVGLQTPGEVIDANFGQEPFIFDIEGELRELRRKTRNLISELSWPKKHGDQQSVLQKMVSSYLVHHGYSQTAELFARSTGQEISEELASMRNRQHIQKLVLDGRIGEAISTTQQLYPGLLRNNQDLLFRLKIRQFIEIISGADSLEYDTVSQGESGAGMDVKTEPCDNSSQINGNNISVSNGNCENGEGMDSMDVDVKIKEEEEEEDSKPGSLLSNPGKLESIIKFGRSLQELAQQIEPDNMVLLHEAFSLLAYSDPWDSPVSAQLSVSGREPVCHALNSAILESKNLPGRPPLEISVAHSRHLLKLMANKELGACAFADTELIH
ncbi:ran-binding protein 9, partial [Eurytemora carolleeae]|uniref:ran-binding protein 9 n=1 Tax=Eurytemora carolleeae TaxID=1294199 RepID=UPI000C768A93